MFRVLSAFLYMVLMVFVVRAATRIKLTELYAVTQGNVVLTTTMKTPASSLRGSNSDRGNPGLKGRTQRSAPRKNMSSASKLSTSSSGLTGGSLAITNQYVYSPYGIEKNLNHPTLNSPRPLAGEGLGERDLLDQTRAPLNLQNNSFGYTGQTTDPSTGLMMLGRFRNYAPGIGRFIQPDTYNSFSKKQINNPMAYVVGNPLILMDPSGHDPIMAFIRLAGLDPKTDIQGILRSIEGLTSNSATEVLESALNLLVFYEMPESGVDEVSRGHVEALLKDPKFKRIFQEERGYPGADEVPSSSFISIVGDGDGNQGSSASSFGGRLSPDHPDDRVAQVLKKPSPQVLAKKMIREYQEFAKRPGVTIPRGDGELNPAGAYRELINDLERELDTNPDFGQGDLERYQARVETLKRALTAMGKLPTTPHLVARITTLCRRQ